MKMASSTDTTSRTLSFPEALREAVWQEMKRDPSVIVMGQGVDDPKAILGTTQGLLEEFGAHRVFDVPLAEDGITGIAVGAAIGGLRPIHVHIRNDFLLLAMNQIVNMAAKVRYMYAGTNQVPLVIRAMIGKSWGQGPQHSQSIYPMLMNVPGLRIVVPSTPYDAKGLMISSIRSNDPVLFIEHRLLYFQKGYVPEEPYELPFGRARHMAEGKDITLVGVSQMAVECLRAHKILKTMGIEADVFDPVTLNPLDMNSIEKSVRKTRHLLVVDNAWMTCGLGAEIFARLCELGLGNIPMKRMGFAPVTCPTTPSLEKHFYPDVEKIVQSVSEILRKDIAMTWLRNYVCEEIEFKGPF